MWQRIEIHTGFWRGNLKLRHHVKDLYIDGRIILKWIRRMDWIDLAEDRDM
jgi:hypothetical protein